MPFSRRLSAAVFAFLLVLSVLTVGSLAFTSEAESANDPANSVVEVETGSSIIWPYTSRTTTFDGRTLPLNLIVYGNTTETRLHLEEQSEGSWNETEPEEEDIGPRENADSIRGTTTAWGSASGSTRYTYVSPGRVEDVDETDKTYENGVWLEESYQLHDGDYLGSRHHIRAYESPDGGEWTAMQAHSEHWDWFLLRHTVDSVETAQRNVESEFMDRWFVRNITREHMDNDRGSDADGWVTVVELKGHDAPIHLLMGGLLFASIFSQVGYRIPNQPTRGTRTARAVALSGALIAVYLFVRFGAITVERQLSPDPRIIAAAFYPLIFAGLPICTYLLARSLDRPLAFSAASLGFAVAILLDYTILGVTTLPVNVLVHRFSAAVALGFIAVGASQVERFSSTHHGFIRTGVTLWVVALLLPLLELLI